MGLREKLLARRGLKRERVEIPGIDEPVYVRQLSPREKDEWESSRWNQSGKRVRLDFTNARARLVAMATVDQAGKQVFTMADVAALGEAEPDMVEALVDVALRLSKLTAKDDEAGEEGHLKNGLASGSPTDSPSASATPPASDSSTS